MGLLDFFTRKKAIEGAKVPCNACGSMILPNTAKNTNGLCMPCSRGVRKSTKTVQSTIGTWVNNVVKKPNGQFVQRIPVRDLTKACAYLRGGRGKLDRCISEKNAL